MDADPFERLDYRTPVDWLDEEPEVLTESTLMEVSEDTKKFLVAKCTQGLAKEVRRRTQSRYPLPKVAATKMPQLDTLMRAEASSGAKTYNKELVKIQSFVLDALAPLTTVTDMHNRRKAPSAKDYREASLAAAEPLGNASARISRLRRERIVTDVNKALLPLALEDDNFVDAPPFLFGLTSPNASRTMWSKFKQCVQPCLGTRANDPFFEVALIRGGETSQGAKAPTISSGATGSGTKAPTSRTVIHNVHTQRCNRHTPLISSETCFKCLYGKGGKQGLHPSNDRMRTSRKASAFHKKLGEVDKRSKSPKYVTGLPITIHRETSPSSQALFPPSSVRINCN